MQSIVGSNISFKIVSIVVAKIGVGFTPSQCVGITGVTKAKRATSIAPIDEGIKSFTMITSLLTDLFFKNLDMQETRKCTWCYSQFSANRIRICDRIRILLTFSHHNS